MAEALSNRQEGREGLKGREFIPDPKGVDRLETTFGTITVIRGHTGDEQTAMVFGVDSPPEYALPEEASRLSRDLLSSLGHNPFARVSAAVMAATGAAIGACAPDNNNNNQPDQPTGLSTNHHALTYDQVLNIGGGQPIEWSELGDRTSNYGKIDGEEHIFVGKNDSAVYVKCQAIEDCLPADANVQTVQGLDGVMAGPYLGPGVFQDQDGNNKFIVNPGASITGPWAPICDIATNAEGTLEVSNCVESNPPIEGTQSIFEKNGIFYALGTGGNGFIRLRNLSTGVDQDIPSPQGNAESCGVGFEAGDVVVGTQYQFYGGIQHCRLITAHSWEELANNLTALNNLNNAGSALLQNPRIAANNILIYSRWDNTPDGDYMPRLWYAIIPDVPQPNPEPDAGADVGVDIEADTQPAHPDVPVIPSPDAGPTPDALAQDVADAADGAVAQPDTAQQPDTTPQPDTAPATDTAPGPDTHADTAPSPDQDSGKPPKPDTQQSPDTLDPACDFAKAQINITEGSCFFEKCTDPFVDITGKCTFEVDLGKPNPVILEIDGTYNIDLFEKIGALLSGKYKVIDNGNKFDTVTSDFLTGVEGTIYLGQLLDSNHYFVACDEGKITIYLVKPNGEKTALITLEAGQEHTFDMDNPTANLTEPTPEQDQDTDQTKEDAIGTPNADTSQLPGADTTIDTSKPPSASGCSCDTTSSKGNFTEFSLALLAIASTLAIRRRHQLEQVIRHRPGTIIAAYARHTFNSLKRAISK